MPMLRFNVHEGASVSDGEPIELPTYTAAQGEAVKLAGAMLVDADGAFWNGGDWRVDVTDPTGLILCLLFIAGVEAAVACVR